MKASAGQQEDFQQGHLAFFGSQLEPTISLIARGMKLDLDPWDLLQTLDLADLQASIAYLDKAIGCGHLPFSLPGVRQSLVILPVTQNNAFLAPREVGQGLVGVFSLAIEQQPS